MCSAEGIVSHQPIGKLADDIAKVFGSFEEFKREFDTAGGALFGSGYVWLVESKEGSLSVVTTHNQVHIKPYISLLKRISLLMKIACVVPGQLHNIIVHLTLCLSLKINKFTIKCANHRHAMLLATVGLSPER